MASTASSSPSPVTILHLRRTTRRTSSTVPSAPLTSSTRTNQWHNNHHHHRRRSTIFAAAAKSGGPNPNRPIADTRIHWENDDDGWLGVGSNNNKTSSSSSTPTPEPMNPETEKEFLGQKFAELLNDSSNSHYQFLGVAPQADLEEIKSAYRRLSKEYHPDTTSLPIKTASDKFMKLREIYDVLSNEETRRFYDWTLAQEVASRQAENMRMRLRDPYMQEVENFESVPDMVDRLGGKNMPLSDQAMSALTIDIAIIVFAICCIVYVLFFKEPY